MAVQDGFEAQFAENLRIYNQERTAAGQDPKKLAAADQRLTQALVKMGMSKGFADGMAQYIKALPEKNLDALQIIVKAGAHRIQSVQDLQKRQAEILMDLQSRPEMSKAEVAGTATWFSTILRYGKAFGFNLDSFADRIDDITKSITDTINIKLNTAGITNGADEAGQNAINFMNALDKSGIAARTAGVAQQEPGNLPTAADTITPGTPVPSAPAARPQGVAVQQFKEDLRALGVDTPQIGRIVDQSARVGGDANRFGDVPADRKRFEMELAGLPQGTITAQQLADIKRAAIEAERAPAPQ